MRGMIAALVTPWDPAGGIDKGGLERLVERVIGAGADGISPGGSTGEGAMLTPDQRVQLTRLVRALTPADLPVISGLPLRTPAEGIAELHALAEAGATAALVGPPAYYPLSDDAVRRLFAELADVAPLPVVLYCIPRFTKVTFSPQVVRELAAHPNIIGIKDSSRDLEYQQDLIAATGGHEFSVITGTDTLLVASLAMGVAGTIAASVNLVPELVKSIFEHYDDGDLAKANALQHELTQLVMVCRAGYFPAGWKAALELAGVCGRQPVPPGTPFTDAQVAKLRDEIADHLPRTTTLRKFRICRPRLHRPRPAAPGRVQPPTSQSFPTSPLRPGRPGRPGAILPHKPLSPQPPHPGENRIAWL